MHIEGFNMQALEGAIHIARSISFVAVAAICIDKTNIFLTSVTAVYTVTHGYSDDGTLCGLDWGSRPLKVPEGGLRG